MKLQLCSYELAKLAKEKGFNWKCDHVIFEDNREIAHLKSQLDPYEKYELDNSIDVPALDLLAKWFRDVHDLIIFIQLDLYSKDTEKYWITINVTTPFAYKERIYSERYTTYDEAQKASLFKAFDLI